MSGVRFENRYPYPMADPCTDAPISVSNPRSSDDINDESDVVVPEDVLSVSPEFHTNDLPDTLANDSVMSPGLTPSPSKFNFLDSMNDDDSAYLSSATPGAISMFTDDGSVSEFVVVNNASESDAGDPLSEKQLVSSPQEVHSEISKESESFPSRVNESDNPVEISLQGNDETKVESVQAEDAHLYGRKFCEALLQREGPEGSEIQKEFEILLKKDNSSKDEVVSLLRRLDGKAAEAFLGALKSTPEGESDASLNEKTEGITGGGDEREFIGTPPVAGPSAAGINRKRKLDEISVEAPAESEKPSESDEAESVAKRVCDEVGRENLEDADLTPYPDDEKKDILHAGWDFWRRPKNDGERLEAVLNFWKTDVVPENKCETYVSPANRARMKDSHATLIHAMAPPGRFGSSYRPCGLKVVSPLVHFDLACWRLRYMQRMAAARIRNDCAQELRQRYDMERGAWDNRRCDPNLSEWVYHCGQNEINSRYNIEAQRIHNFTNFRYRNRWFWEVVPLQEEEAHIREKLQVEAQHDWDVLHKDPIKNLMPVERFLNMERMCAVARNYGDVYGRSGPSLR